MSSVLSASLFGQASRVVVIIIYIRPYHGRTTDSFELDQSRRCPLCSQDVGEYLMHNVRSKYDYQKHYLAPLRTSAASQAIATVRVDARRRAERRREVEWGRRRRRELEEADELERAIEKRRWVYRNQLYAKVSPDIFILLQSTLPAKHYYAITMPHNSKSPCCSTQP